MKNVKSGLTLLLNNPTQHRYYAIDKYWFSLQEIDNWFLIIPPTVVQIEGYSDIEMHVTNYQELMTDLDKKEFVRKSRLKQLLFQK
jgi:hypothetical protein